MCSALLINRLRPLRCQLRIFSNSDGHRVGPHRDQDERDQRKSRQKWGLISTVFSEGPPSQQSNRQRGRWFHSPARKTSRPAFRQNDRPFQAVTTRVCDQIAGPAGPCCGKAASTSGKQFTKPWAKTTVRLVATDGDIAFAAGGEPCPPARRF